MEQKLSHSYIKTTETTHRPVEKNFCTAIPKHVKLLIKIQANVKMK